MCKLIITSVIIFYNFLLPFIFVYLHYFITLLSLHSSASSSLLSSYIPITKASILSHPTPLSHLKIYSMPGGILRYTVKDSQKIVEDVPIEV